MDFWPAGTGHELVESKQSPKPNKKGYNYNSSTTGPVLSIGNGTLTAAVLRTYQSTQKCTRKRLEWDFITQKGRPLRSYPSSTLLPEHKPDPTQPNKLPLHRRAEEGARFLRQCFPDVDIPFEIIKEYIEDDYAHQARHNALPTMGNCLATIHSPHAVNDRQFAFAFPMGPLKNQLNLSSSTWSRSKGGVLNVASSPVVTFDTPLLQIVSSPYIQELSSTQDLPTLAVRTMSFCALFSVNFGSTRSIYSQPSVNQLALVKPRESGTIVDIASSPFTPSRILLVNGTGAISFMQTDNAIATLLPLGAPPTGDSFWRGCWANEENTVLRASSSYLELLDLRGGPATLGMKLTSREKITAIEGRSGDGSLDPHLITITTDKRIIWLDDRYLAIPLISWEHQRAGDMTLRATSCSLRSRSITCLSSQNNGLLTIYDVSVSSGLLHSNGAPQILECSPGSRKRIGQTFYRHPASESGDVSFVELTADGGLSSTRLSPGEDIEGMTADANGIILSERRGGMESQWAQQVPIVGSSEVSVGKSEASSKRESFEVDFSRVYQEFLGRMTSKFTANESIDQVRDVLERMPRIGQEVDQPLESILTIYDIASYASAEPGNSARSGFLTGTVLSSQRAQSAFQNGHIICSEAIGKGSAWSFNLTRSIDLIRTLDDRINPPGPQLVTYDEYQHDMQCLLNIDLALFNDVCSLTPFNGVRKGAPSTQLEEDMLQKATQSLSIIRMQDEPPPPPTFSFLRPRPQQISQQDSPSNRLREMDPVGNLQDISHGTTLLLSQWELGSDPETLGYMNPYPDSTPEAISSRSQKSVVQEPERAGVSPQTKIQPFSAPPRIGLVQSAPSIRASRGLNLRSLESTQAPLSVGTQPTSSRVDLTTRSHDPDFLGISTQVLPGKHGGRSKGGVKKPKKRMGGF